MELNRVKYILRNFYSNDKVKFLGLFNSDNIRTSGVLFKTKEQSYMVFFQKFKNTNIVHLTVLFFDGSKTITYFDSYGVAPGKDFLSKLQKLYPLSYTYLFSRVKIQKKNTCTCSLILFALLDQVFNNNNNNNNNNTAAAVVSNHFNTSIEIAIRKLYTIPAKSREDFLLSNFKLKFPSVSLERLKSCQLKLSSAA